MELPQAPDPQTPTPAFSTPLDQALSRFHLRTHRFPSERRLDLLRPFLDQLRSHLLVGGSGAEAILSPRFCGHSLAPDREIVLRQDSVFEVRQAEWDGQPAAAASSSRENDSAGAAAQPGSMPQPLGASEFINSLRRLLGLHGPLDLADLHCVSIAERAGASRPSEGTLLTRIRFELASLGARGQGSGVRNEGAAPKPESRIPNPETGRWQATGEWEIAWEAEAGARDQVPGARGEPQTPRDKPRTPNPEPGNPLPNWKIVNWRPLNMRTVEGPAVVFTDVTAAAFGRDPSYATHVLRDTNYWRSVLDEATGIDIFGNYGVGVGDADGDGRDEIYLCQPQGLPNRLYRQREPGIFEDVAARAGVDVLDATSMALFADVLNRGRQDLILITQSSPVLFLNDGHGHFTLAHEAFPPAALRASLTGAAMADYDGDGFLDLYVCAYAYFQGEDGASVPIPFYDAHNGPPNHLYRNRGDGTFADVTKASGLDRGNDRFSFACAWNDIDGDGWPDLCVVNDFGQNNLYWNRGDGSFEEIADGLAGFGSGMSAAFADWDGDGAAEFYVGNMWSPAGERVTADPEFQERFSDLARPAVRQFAMGNAFYRNTREQGTGDREKGKSESLESGGRSPKSKIRSQGLEEVPDAAGAALGRWAWCSDSLDLENDGRPDLCVVNGYLSSPEPELASLDAYLWEEVVALSPHSTAVSSSEYRAAWSAMYQLAHQGHSWNGNERNVFFLNLGEGRFADASAVSGLDFRDDGRAFAVFDYDGDGDCDLVIHSRTGPQLRLLRNDLASSNHSLALRLTAKSGNRDAIGAKVELETPSGRQTRFLNCGSGFLAQHSKEQVFGLAQQTGASVVRVRWPGGAVSEWRNLEAGHRYFLIEGQGPPRREPLSGSGTRGLESAIRVLCETPPDRFSTWLVDPLPVPAPEPLRLVPREGGALPYQFLLLWNPAKPQHGALETFLKAQKEIPSRLVWWGTGKESAAVSAAIQDPPWQADSRFRLLWSTVLAYLFDRRREPVLPIGLLFGTGERPRESTKLVKVYWGGAEAEELLRDVRSDGKTDAAALPFPGRAILCSFRRDTRTLGTALALAKLFPEAETYLAQAVENNRTDADALYDLAFVRRELGKAESAISGVRTALSVRPDFAEAENLLGVLLMQAGQRAPAQTHLEKATRQAPDFVEAWNNLGYVHLLQGDLAPAREALEKALGLAPNFPDALNNLGIVSARQGDAEKAGELFGRVLSLQPENEQAANNLGVLYAKEGNTAEALETFRGLLHHNPDAASVLLNLARVEMSLGKAVEVRNLLTAWLARHPDDSAAQKLLEQAIEK